MARISEDLISNLRGNMTAYLQTKGVNTRKPFRCLNPEHNDHDPSMSLNKKNPELVKCFGQCDRSYNIFDLIGFDYGLTDFKDQVKKACDIYGYSYQEEEAEKDGPLKTAQNAQKRQNGLDTQERAANAPRGNSEGVEGNSELAAKIKAWQADIEGGRAYFQGRGLSAGIIERFGLGYDRERKAAIIPIGTDYYIARRTASDGPRYLNPEGLNVRLFGAEYLGKPEAGPIFITEGAFDALSIEEAGGHALSLNSTSNADLFIATIDATFKPGPRHIILLALDNDADGMKTTAKLIKALETRHIRHVAVNVAGSRKDASEALEKDGREALAAAVVQAQDAEAEEYKKISGLGRLSDFLDGIKGRANTPCIPTGYGLLDQVLDGGLYEGLYVIGAISALGKTTFALQIADQIAKAGQDVLFFTLEMSADDLIAKSLSRLTKSMAKNPLYAKTARDITRYDKYAIYGTEEKNLITKALEEYGKYAGHLFFYEGKEQTGAHQIREAVARHTEIMGKAPVVIVDYLQVIAPRNGNSSDKQNADRAVLDLKRISRDHKIPVITLSSFSRAFYDKEASMEAFKESGGIEYSADVLMGLHYTLKKTKTVKGENGKTHNVVVIDTAASKKADPRVVELVVLKNRRGESEAAVRYNYYCKNDLFDEVLRVD